MIYEGVPNWAEIGGGGNPQESRSANAGKPADSHSNDRRMCALAMLENRGGNLKVTKPVENHCHLDQAYGFGQRWVAGAKD